MVYGFSVAERALLLANLPVEGNLVTLKVLRELRQELEFSEQDLAEFEILDEGGKLSWNKQKDRPKEVELGVRATALVRETLKKLETVNALRLELLGLYEVLEAQSPEVPRNAGSIETVSVVGGNS